MPFPHAHIYITIGRVAQKILGSGKHKHNAAVPEDRLTLPSHRHSVANVCSAKEWALRRTNVLCNLRHFFSNNNHASFSGTKHIYSPKRPLGMPKTAPTERQCFATRYGHSHSVMPHKEKEKTSGNCKADKGGASQYAGTAQLATDSGPMTHGAVPVNSSTLALSPQEGKGKKTDSKL